MNIKSHIHTVRSLQGLQCSALRVCLWACSSGSQKVPEAVCVAFEQETHPVLLSQPAFPSWHRVDVQMATEGHWGLAASPRQRCLQEVQSDSGNGKRSWFPTTWMGFGTTGPGLLYADEEIWKRFQEVSVIHHPPAKT